MILKVKPRGEKAFEMHLEQDRFRLGRSSQNDLKLPADPALSRFHAEILRSNGEYWVKDLDSRNGTFVNGARIRARTRLFSGDRIAIGETEITFGTESQPFVTLEESSVPPDMSTTSIPLDDLLRPAPAARKGPDAAGGGPPGLRPDVLPIITKAGRELIQHRPLEEVFELILDLVFQAIPAERACLMLREGEQGRLAAKAARDRQGRFTGPIKISTTIAKMVVEDKKSVVTTDAQADQRFQGKESIVLQGVRSAMCVPLWNNREVIGLIYVDTHAFGTRFTEEDMRLLTILGNIAAVKIENSKLVKEQLVKERLEEELEKAAEIQKGFLPTATPEVAGLEIFGSNVPSQAVGGDAFDFVLRGGDRLIASIGDVSGKGMSAALMMAHFQAYFRAWIETGVSLPDLARRLNQMVIASNQINRFVTFFVAEIEPQGGTLAYCNAGHNPPFVVRAGGEIERLTTGGLILGVLPEADFDQQTLRLQPGDLLFLYSDGLTESVDPEEEQFGEARLEAFLREHHGLPVAEVQERLQAAVREFTAGAPPADDLTFVLVKKT